jgi:hypothetical protein
MPRGAGSAGVDEGELPGENDADAVALAVGETDGAVDGATSATLADTPGLSRCVVDPVPSCP